MLHVLCIATPVCYADKWICFVQGYQVIYMYGVQNDLLGNEYRSHLMEVYVCVNEKRVEWEINGMFVFKASLPISCQFSSVCVCV